MLSLALKIPEMQLAPEEGKQLALSLQNLQRFYNVQVTEKALAWSNLTMALVAVYGTRIGAITARKAAERKSGPLKGQSVPREATVIRPTQFAQRPQQVYPSPDGDPVSAMPTTAQRPPATNGDAAFASTPPELI